MDEELLEEGMDQGIGEELGLGEDEDLLEEDSLEGEDLLDDEEEMGLDEGVSIVSLTADDLPDLQDLQVGEEITLRVSNVSDDGVYELSVGGAPIQPEAPEEELGINPEESIGAAL